MYSCKEDGTKEDNECMIAHNDPQDCESKPLQDSLLTYHKKHNQENNLQYQQLLHENQDQIIQHLGGIDCIIDLCLSSTAYIETNQTSINLKNLQKLLIPTADANIIKPDSSDQKISTNVNTPIATAQTVSLSYYSDNISVIAIDATNNLYFKYCEKNACYLYYILLLNKWYSIILISMAAMFMLIALIYRWLHFFKMDLFYDIFFHIGYFILVVSQIFLRVKNDN